MQANLSDIHGTVSSELRQLCIDYFTAFNVTLPSGIPSMIHSINVRIVSNTDLNAFYITIIGDTSYSSPWAFLEYQSLNNQADVRLSYTLRNWKVFNTSFNWRETFQIISEGKPDISLSGHWTIREMSDFPSLIICPLGTSGWKVLLQSLCKRKKSMKQADFERLVLARL